jgi:uridine kinase
VTDAQLSVEDCIARVLAAAQQATPRLGGSRLVALDGPAGSGKTSIAAGIEEMLTKDGTGVSTLHMDDLYDGWTGLDAALEERVLDQVLRPLAADRQARWQQYDWYAGRFDRWHLLDPTDVLILEGCGSGAARYAPYTSLLVWVEARRETRVRRGVERDGEQVLANWLAWMDLETTYFATNRTSARAEVTCWTG